MTPAGSEHGYVAGELHAELRNYVKANGLGRVYAAETGFKLASEPDTARPGRGLREPRARRGGGRRERILARGAGSRVEVVSPGDAHSQVVEKAFFWLDAGCRMVLTAEPEQRAVTVYHSRTEIRILTAGAGDSIEGGDVILG